MVDDILFADGHRRLKVSFSGVDRDSSTVSADQFHVNLYAFEDGPPVKTNFGHSLDLDGAARLYSFLDSLPLIKDRAAGISKRLVEVGEAVPGELVDALLDPRREEGFAEALRVLLATRPELLRTILETEITTFDVNCLAYRRAELIKMKRMLEDPEFFEIVREQAGGRGPEHTWQHFFEKNQWIFGLSLNYLIGEGVQQDKLEQVVSGYNIGRSGKRVDALLATRGLLRSLCYVEIKTHETELVHSSEYRPGVWRPSSELIGAVAQLQKTVQMAVEQLGASPTLPIRSTEGSPEEKFLNYSPRAVVVCGSLREFCSGLSPDLPKFSSFELYRRSLNNPEVVTFDELYDRAHATVEAGLARA